MDKLVGLDLLLLPLAELTKLFLYLVAALGQGNHLSNLADNQSLDFFNRLHVRLEIRLEVNYLDVETFFYVLDLIGTDCNKAAVKVVGQVLEHALDVTCENSLDLLLDGRSSQS